MLSRAGLGPRRNLPLPAIHSRCCSFHVLSDGTNNAPRTDFSLGYHWKYFTNFFPVLQFIKWQERHFQEPTVNTDFIYVIFTFFPITPDIQAFSLVDFSLFPIDKPAHQWVAISYFLLNLLNRKALILDILQQRWERASSTPSPQLVNPVTVPREGQPRHEFWAFCLHL